MSKGTTDGKTIFKCQKLRFDEKGYASNFSRVGRNWQCGSMEPYCFFSQTNLHGTPLKEQSTCLCHFSCTRLQFNAIFHILQMVSEMFCSALNEPREGTRAVKSDFCPHVIPRTSRDAALLGHSSGGLLLQQLRLST